MINSRVTRTIREWTVSGWDETETTHFIYDGWNIIEEYDITTSNSVLVRNLTWGQDLGGAASLQGAGGVGGLLMVEEITGTTTTAYHFHYHGNGNVTEVTDLNGNPAATYRYDAFGNTLISTGSYANDNRYRFSTKPLDAEVTNAPLYYYAYRYYDPVTGRWPSRDPIEEDGGINLYKMVENDGINAVDNLGMSRIKRKYYYFKIKGVITFDCVCDRNDGEITKQDEASCPKDITKTSVFLEGPYMSRPKGEPKEASKMAVIAGAILKAFEYCANTNGRCTKVEDGDTQLEDVQININIIEVEF